MYILYFELTFADLNGRRRQRRRRRRRAAAVGRPADEPQADMDVENAENLLNADVDAGQNAADDVAPENDQTAANPDAPAEAPNADNHGAPDGADAPNDAQDIAAAEEIEEEQNIPPEGNKMLSYQIK